MQKRLVGGENMLPVVLPQVQVEGPGMTHLELSLDDLKTKFQAVTIPVTLQCSGNRRNDMSAVKLVKGLEWDAGKPAPGPRLRGRSRVREAYVCHTNVALRCILLQGYVWRNIAMNPSGMQDVQDGITLLQSWLSTL